MSMKKYDAASNNMEKDRLKYQSQINTEHHARRTATNSAFVSWVMIAGLVGAFVLSAFNQ